MRRLGLLAAALRAGGVRVGVGELLAAHRALAAVDPASRRDAYNALRTVLCSRHDDLEVFDAAFVEVFGEPSPTDERAAGLPGDARRWPGSRCRKPPSPPSAGTPAAAPTELDADAAPVAWSSVELLREKDFAEYTRRRARAGRARLIARLAARGPRRPSRRTRPAHRRGPRPGRRAPRPAPHDARVAALRRRARRAALARAHRPPAAARARLRRVRARWSRTRGCSCSTSRRRSRPAAGSRRSRSARA